MNSINRTRTIDAYGYFFTAAKQPLERRSFTIPEINSDQVVVEVAGCGLCHTDLGFINGAVKTKHELPLILGHEISGKVVAAGQLFEKILGKNVIIPAVLPCGECELCRSERDNICQAQKMPGNDFHGGFASHIVVPGCFLCELPSSFGDFGGAFQLSQLSVVADAVTTPYQSLKRSGLKKGDLAIVIGTGGIGIYMVQHAKNAGASVIALDIDMTKLEKARTQGADAVVCTAGLSEKDVKDKIRALVSEHRFPKHQWKVFETSGSTAGQSTGFSLLSFAGVLGIVGFTMDKLNVRLSNVMAYDADIFGNWGCRPAYYAPVVQDVLNGKIKLQENICEYPLDQINEVIALALAHKLDKRAIFKP